MWQRLNILFFHKPSKRDDINLGLPKLYIDNNQIQQSESIKFLGIFLDENLTWKEPIKYIENKIAKNIDIKPYLNKSVYYLFTIATFTVVFPMLTLLGGTPIYQTWKKSVPNKNIQYV